MKARNRLQILVNRSNVVIRHVLINGPWHDLQKISVEGLWYATGIRRPGTRRMQVIEIFASPEDGEEFFKGVIPFRQTSLGSRCQIAGDDMR